AEHGVEDDRHGDGPDRELRAAQGRAQLDDRVVPEQPRGAGGRAAGGVVDSGGGHRQAPSGVVVDSSVRARNTSSRWASPLRTSRGGASTRTRPAATTTTRSATASASGRSWVAKRMVAPSATHARARRQNARREATSM